MLSSLSTWTNASFLPPQASARANSSQSLALPVSIRALASCVWIPLFGDAWEDRFICAHFSEVLANARVPSLGMHSSIQGGITTTWWFPHGPSVAIKIATHLGRAPRGFDPPRPPLARSPSCMPFFPPFGVAFPSVRWVLGGTSSWTFVSPGSLPVVVLDPCPTSTLHRATSNESIREDG